ncbi:ankyrin repeat domain-containing protein [Bremerella sp. JC817]|uniref:ankyrin repeat domain-containing protein n=1 Tax=Bremerella sp. JC817 TaxID=3231756 RepID=UPI0034574C69
MKSNATRRPRLATYLLGTGLVFALLGRVVSAQEETSEIKPPRPGMISIEAAFKDKPNVSALVAAMLQNNETEARTLIANGADINAKGANGLRPIHIAALYGSDEGVTLAIALGAKVDVATGHHESPLQYALYPLRHPEVFRTLVEADADLAWASEQAKLATSLSLGEYILGHGIQFGRDDPEPIKLYWFYLENGGDIDELNANGMSMLSVAFNQFSYNFAGKLLDRGANPYSGEPSLMDLLERENDIRPPKKLAVPFSQFIEKTKQPRDVEGLKAKAQEQLTAHRKFREQYEQTRRYQAENQSSGEMKKAIEVIESELSRRKED